MSEIDYGVLAYTKAEELDYRVSKIEKKRKESEYKILNFYFDKEKTANSKIGTETVEIISNEETKVLIMSNAVIDFSDATYVNVTFYANGIICEQRKVYVAEGKNTISISFALGGVKKGVKIHGEYDAGVGVVSLQSYELSVVGNGISYGDANLKIEGKDIGDDIIIGLLNSTTMTVREYKGTNSFTDYYQCITCGKYSLLPYQDGDRKLIYVFFIDNDKNLRYTILNGGYVLADSIKIMSNVTAVAAFMNFDEIQVAFVKRNKPYLISSAIKDDLNFFKEDRIWLNARTVNDAYATTDTNNRGYISFETDEGIIVMRQKLLPKGSDVIKFLMEFSIAEV